MSSPLIPAPTTLRATRAWVAVAALSAGVVWGDAAMAQAQRAQTAAQAEARATTQSLNTGPSDTVLRPDRVTASPPLTEAERPARIRPPAAAPAPMQAIPAQADPIQDTSPRPAVVSPAPAPSSAPTRRPAQVAQDQGAQDQGAQDDAVTRLLNGGAETAEVADDAAPVDFPPLQQGYYVRSDMDCDQVWPGEGDLAWLSDVSFTLDFGGCTPGQIRQVGPALWHEDQRCQTELGNDGGLYSIEYRQTAADALVRKATLSIDGSVEEARWKACPVEQVPEEARFHRAATEPLVG